MKKRKQVVDVAKRREKSRERFTKCADSEAKNAEDLPFRHPTLTKFFDKRKAKPLVFNTIIQKSSTNKI